MSCLLNQLPECTEEMHKEECTKNCQSCIWYSNPKKEDFHVM